MSSQDSKPTTLPFAFKPCQAVLKKDGAIVSADNDFRRQFRLPIEGPIQYSFGESLGFLNESWPSLATNLVQNCPTEIFLPWETPPFGLRAKSLEYLDDVLVMILPDLSSDANVLELAANEMPDSDDVSLMENLFLRLKRVQSRILTYEHHFPGILFEQRPDYSFIHLSNNFFKQFGFHPKAFYRSGSAFLDLICPQDLDFFLGEIQKGINQQKTFSLRYRIQLPSDNRIVHLLDIRSPKRLSNGTFVGFEGVWLDITRQAIAEQRLTSTGWRETLNTLTGGLLHDFKNNITGISTLTEVYCSSIDDQHPWYEGMTMMRKSALSAQNTVLRIMELNREVFGEKDYHDLSAMIKDQASLFRAVLPKVMELKTEFTEKEIPVYMDEVSFRQMILNLLMNARDASPDDGTIEMYLSLAEAMEPAFPPITGCNFVPRTRGAIIEIRDHGCGISPHQLKEVFNPYFTTKEVNKGSGLGLYNANIFAENHEGKIAIASDLGKGTSVFVFIPITDFTENLSMEAESNGSNFGESSPLMLFHGDSEPTELIERLSKQDCAANYIADFSRLKQLISEHSDRKFLIVFVDPLLDEDQIHFIQKVATEYSDIRVVHLHSSRYPCAALNELPEVFHFEVEPFHPSDRIVWQLIEIHPARDASETT